LDTDWIKAAASQVRMTIRQATNKVNRLGNSNAERMPRPALDDPYGNKDHPEGNAPGADNR